MNQAIHGPFREAQRLVNLKLQQRDNGRVSRAAVMNLNQLGSRLIGTISQIDLQRLDAQMFERGLSARTIEYINAVLESALRQAVRWKMLAEDPCVGVDLPSVKHKEMEALSVEECPRFLELAGKSEWFPVLALALTTGMRASEYLGLKWTDIDWQRRTTSVCRTVQVIGSEWTYHDTKRKRSRRIVNLQNFVLEALMGLKQLQESRKEGSASMHLDLVLVSASGLPLKQSIVKRGSRRLLAFASIRPARIITSGTRQPLWASRRAYP